MLHCYDHGKEREIHVLVRLGAGRPVGSWDSTKEIYVAACLMIATDDCNQ
jgi:hypothetical protein